MGPRPWKSNLRFIAPDQKHDVNAPPPTKFREFPGDAEQVERLGQKRLLNETLRDDLEVASLARDQGIDLIPTP